jgi:hypothetical protein
MMNRISEAHFHTNVVFYLIILILYLFVSVHVMKALEIIFSLETCSNLHRDISINIVM